MAKKPKVAKPEAGEATPPEGEAQKPAGGRKKLILAGAGAVVVLAGAGGGFYYMKSKAAHDGPVAPKAHVAYVDLKDMTVNLTSPGQQGGVERTRYLKLKVSLEVSDPKVVTDVQPLLPRIEDAFQVYTRELRPSDLEGSAGVYRLKEELLRRVNVAIHPARVEAVLLKEILVQ
ncbi:flagellar basal body-associated protein FliL [Alsobacter sp. SYSU M60028]|uniref:Flagellar protein FliL n=1 Tax=Alsobacter ponti TaxID=2962936 RepID=A0ABT1L7J0_9HYPH|nr:flagellar basal body-associated protein FliL [Alsobacter ponti]MCP8937329.1 flagellar basal body-associated protein FliL [Alsobacter ponti]